MITFEQIINWIIQLSEWAIIIGLIPMLLLAYLLIAKELMRAYGDDNLPFGATWVHGYRFVLVSLSFLFGFVILLRIIYLFAQS